MKRERERERVAMTYRLAGKLAFIPSRSVWHVSKILIFKISVTFSPCQSATLQHLMLQSSSKKYLEISNCCEAHSRACFVATSTSMPPALTSENSLNVCTCQKCHKITDCCAWEWLNWVRLRRWASESLDDDLPSKLWRSTQTTGKKQTKQFTKNKINVKMQNKLAANS